MRTYEPPTVTIPDQTKPGHHYDEVVTHPAYGQISASRVSCGGVGNGQVLYGSDFAHNGYVRITITHSELNRGLSNDWMHERDEIVEVALSEAQWATFVSTLNMGSGTPCTLQAINRRQIPQIPDPPNRQKQFQKEADDRIANGMEALKELRRAVDALPGTSAKAKKDLLDKLATTERELGSNIEFVADQFTEHMERVTEHAKIEVAAYVTQTIQRAGLKALAEDLIRLPDRTLSTSTASISAGSQTTEEGKPE